MYTFVNNGITYRFSFVNDYSEETIIHTTIGPKNDYTGFAELKFNVLRRMLTDIKIVGENPGLSLIEAFIHGLKSYCGLRNVPNENWIIISKDVYSKLSEVYCSGESLDIRPLLNQDRLCSIDAVQYTTKQNEKVLSIGIKIGTPFVHAYVTADGYLMVDTSSIPELIALSMIFRPGCMCVIKKWLNKETVSLQYCTANDTCVLKDLINTQNDANISVQVHEEPEIFIYYINF